MTSSRYSFDGAEPGHNFVDDLFWRLSYPPIGAPLISAVPLEIDDGRHISGPEAPHSPSGRKDRCLLAARRPPELSRNDIPPMDLPSISQIPKAVPEGREFSILNTRSPELLSCKQT
jgi:hypothetical protein